MAGLPELDAIAVAKGWLLELIAARPLADAAVVPVAAFAREAPALVTVALAAVADDVVLDALQARGRHAQLAARAAAISGATDAPAVVAACEGLRVVLTAELRRGLRSDVQAEVAERVAHVTATLMQRSLAELVVPGPTGASGPPTEYDALADVRVRDIRSALSGPSWDDVVARALERRVHDAGPFAVLAGEVVDAERWLAADPSGAVVAGVQEAVAAALRPGDRLIAEGPGRFWVLAPATDRDAAQALARDFAGAVAAAGSPAGAAFGVAECPADGEERSTLIACADEALFAALAAGVPVLP